jgi:hypothetical protein
MNFYIMLLTALMERLKLTRMGMGVSIDRGMGRGRERERDCEDVEESHALYS